MPLSHVRRGRVSPAFIQAVINSAVPRDVQASVAGWPHYNALSTLLHTRRRISLTRQTRDRLARLADLVGYPRESMFIEEEQA